MSIYLEKTITILPYKAFGKELHKISSIKCNTMISKNMYIERHKSIILKLRNRIVKTIYYVPENFLLLEFSVQSFKQFKLC